MADSKEKESNADKVSEEQCFLLNLQSLICPYHYCTVKPEECDKKPNVFALTETWLTKSDTEPIKQCKMGRAKLKEDYSIASCHPMLLISPVLVEAEETCVSINKSL